MPNKCQKHCIESCCRPTPRFLCIWQIEIHKSQMIVDNKSNNSFYMHFEISPEINEAFYFWDFICILLLNFTQTIIFNNITTPLQLYHILTIEYYSKLYVAILELNGKIKLSSFSIGICQMEDYSYTSEHNTIHYSAILKSEDNKWCNAITLRYYTTAIMPHLCVCV